MITPRGVNGLGREKCCDASKNAALRTARLPGGPPGTGNRAGAGPPCGIAVLSPVHNICGLSHLAAHQADHPCRRAPLKSAPQAR